jgi:hypothetical protein
MALNDLSIWLKLFNS